MEIFSQWIQSIVIYLLLVSFVYQIFPDSEYKKYMKVCTGLILMLVTVWPVVKWSGSDAALTFLLDLETTKMEARDFEAISQAAESEKDNAVTRTYKTQLEQKIYAMFEDSPLCPLNAEIEIVEDVENAYYGSVQSVSVTAAVDESYIKSVPESQTQAAAVHVEDIAIEPIVIDAQTANEAQAVCQSYKVSDEQIKEIEIIRKKIAEALFMNVEDVRIRIYQI